ncbi:MAG TPA: AraC family transcriptional regulator [Chitinophagaceae bacterium]|nr:AraC family transcriptional regulator [Chitinophagaceae bacterium]
MISINYRLTSFRDFLHQIAVSLQTSVVDDTLIIPPGYGNGFFRVIQVTSDIEALVYDINFKVDVFFKRQRNGHFYTLIFDDIQTTEGFSYKIGNDQLNDKSKRKSAFYLTSFLYDVEYIIYKNTELKGTRILLSEPWMQQYLKLSENENLLEKYISLKTSGIWYRPVDAELKELLNEIVAENKEMPLLFFQNKLMRIIEHFFAWLYDEMKVLSTKSGISKEDIEAAQKIEALITEDITILPPTIKELSREAAMSESKLKKIFKVVYTLPPYEYFQKQRMQKAMQLLLSGNYAIKDVGYTLGYANLSNFTLAFKKEFGKLPSDIIRNSK